MTHWKISLNKNVQEYIQKTTVDTTLTNRLQAIKVAISGRSVIKKASFG